MSIFIATTLQTDPPLTFHLVGEKSWPDSSFSENFQHTDEKNRKDTEGSICVIVDERSLMKNWWVLLFLPRAVVYLGICFASFCSKKIAVNCSFDPGIFWRQQIEAFSYQAKVTSPLKHLSAEVLHVRTRKDRGSRSDHREKYI